MTDSNAALPRPQSGHPPGLYVLFFAEMWERFCYYGMRTLLVLYLTKELLFADNPAYGVYGAYTALVYAAPVLGGKLADELLGYRRAVVMGGILMALGEFMLVGNGIVTEGNTLLFLGMGTIIIGNGYFKANISSIVGKLYEEGDPRRDSGFTIFYMGINIGAVLATTVCGYVGEVYGYKWGFGLAGVGMLIGITIFMLGQGKLEGHGFAPDEKKLHEPWKGPLSRWHMSILGSLAVIPVLYFLLVSEGAVADAGADAAGWVNTVAMIQQKVLFGLSFVDVLLGVTMAIVVINLLRGANEAGKTAPPEKRTVQRDRMIVLFILMIFNIMFWALFEQAGTSLTLFADRAVDRQIDLLNWELPTTNTQAFNPAFIIIFGSVFSWMWVKLDKKGVNPNIPLKFAFGLIQLGCGFLILLVGASMVGSDYKVALVFLVVMYLLHTTGELFISPIGLSMVTKLAPAHLTGTVMGAWFLSFAFANKVAAGLAKLTGAEEGGAEGAEMAAQEVMNTYIGTYQTFGFVIVGVGVLLILLSGWLNKMMHGVK
ncbi:Dipeptide and tripeptide permease B [Enhygromyxa salina]|uniref:Dipeptide and tripeptide permease B n=1 Tax=Enhygromyxa salina TaxID=215803 RepID=A0A2S9YAN3_9BACT|nr:peptide MFS transporter [Enhygromyxa salina]PRQ02170.1 Dipeptide and tripeptide permease B [Enhygromyxa salina]